MWPYGGKTACGRCKTRSWHHRERPHVIVCSFFFKKMPMSSPPLSRLARFPVGLFAMPVGLFALAGTWRRALGFGWEVALPVGDAIAGLALLVLVLLLLAYAAKAWRHPQVIKGE